MIKNALLAVVDFIFDLFYKLVSMAAQDEQRIAREAARIEKERLDALKEKGDGDEEE